MLESISNLLRPFNEIIGALGILLAFYFWHVSKRVKKPRFDATSRTVLEVDGDAPEGLQITYKGQPQSRITSTRVIFWNDGKEPIRKGDIARTDRLRIELNSEIRVLSVYISSATSNACNPKASDPVFFEDEQCSRVYIDFDFLNYRDGFAVEIIHNGEEPVPVSVKGTLIGSAAIEEFSLDEFGTRNSGLIGFTYMFATLSFWVIALSAADWVTKVTDSVKLGSAFAVVGSVAVLWVMIRLSVRVLPGAPRQLLNRKSAHKNH